MSYEKHSDDDSMRPLHWRDFMELIIAAVYLGSITVAGVVIQSLLIPLN